MSFNSHNNKNIDLKMPVLFIGHGSPMNAIETNEYTITLSKIAASIPKPKAILCISAHWTTQGTKITSMEKPKTIHDFYGFPRELYKIEYPAPGDPELAKIISDKVNLTKVILDSAEWGLDHGTWAVLKHIYSEANIPVLQLSLDMSKPTNFHFDLGRQLSELRLMDILLIGSGNVVHNLRKINWDEKAEPFEWATEFNDWIKLKINSRSFIEVATEALALDSGKLSHPTPEHLYPLFYILGASDPGEEISFLYDKIELGSISMLSFKIG